MNFFSRPSHPSPLRRILGDLSLMTLVTFGSLSALEWLQSGFVADFLNPLLFLLVGAGALILWCVAGFSELAVPGNSEQPVRLGRRVWFFAALWVVTALIVRLQIEAPYRWLVGILVGAVVTLAMFLLGKETETDDPGSRPGGSS